MNAAAQNFLDTMSAKELKVRESFETNNNETVVRCSWNMENTSVDVLVIFPENCQYAWLRCYNFARAPKDHLGQAMIVCNQMNRSYKWVKFSVDDDGNLSAEDDAVIDVATCGEECLELMVRMTRIVDEAYPTIMKAIYA